MNTDCTTTTLRARRDIHKWSAETWVILVLIQVHVEKIAYGWDSKTAVVVWVEFRRKQIANNKL